MQNEHENFIIPEELLESIDNDSAIDSDDDAELELQERIKDLNLDDPEAVWNALTEDEKNEFEALLNQGDLGSIIPQWEPWWTYKKEDKLVEDMDKKDDAESKALKNCPLLKAVPQITTLTVRDILFLISVSFM